MSEAPSTSVSQKCSCNCSQLAERVQALEQTLHEIVKLQTAKGTPNSTAKGTPNSTAKRTPNATAKRTPKRTTKRSKTKNPPVQRRSVKKGERMDSLSDSLYETALADYESFRLGPRTGKKDRDNARQSRTHALRFCKYMIASCSASAGQHDMMFLKQMDRLRVWPSYLANKGYAPTSIKNMLLNATHFLKHIGNSFLKESKLRQKDIDKICYEIKRIMADVTKKVVVHRQAVMRQKTANQVSAAEEVDFMIAAREKIPVLFERIAHNPDSMADHSLLMGYIIGYLCMLTGHRVVVLTNMSKDNVQSPDTWKNGQRFRVLVNDHKTVRTFGQASLSLNAEEYGWLASLVSTSSQRRGGQSNYVFHTINGQRLEKPLIFLMQAWKDAGMRGTVNFGKIRSSVSTQASRHLNSQEREQVAKSMCHDIQTAERLYVALPDKDESYKTRNLRMNALAKAAAKEQTDTSSSEEDEEKFVLQSETETSDSSLPLEDFDVVHERRARILARGTATYRDEPPSSMSVDESSSVGTQTSKRRLIFRDTSPLKCTVKVIRLDKATIDYYSQKLNTSKPPVEPTCRDTSMPPVEQTLSCPSMPQVWLTASCPSAPGMELTASFQSSTKVRLTASCTSVAGIELTATFPSPTRIRLTASCPASPNIPLTDRCPSPTEVRLTASCPSSPKVEMTFQG